MWLFILLFLFVNPVLAQSSPSLFDQYQKDYLYQYDLYQRAYQNYTDKKQVFTQYGTITAQNDKFQAAIAAINARDSAYKSYLMALRVSLDSYKDANPDATTNVQTNLSNWETWFSDQQTLVSAFTNDSDLAPWTVEFKNNLIQIQQTISTALVQNVVNLRQQTLNLIQQLAIDIKNNPKIKPESQQWLDSITAKSNLVSTNINQAMALTQKKQLSGRFSDFYPEAKTKLNLSRQYLIEITRDLKLIVTKFYQP